MSSFIALSAGVAAPAGMAGTGAPPPLRLTVGTAGPIGSLDPRTGDGVIAREVWNIQYPTLTALDPISHEPTAGIAIAWIPSAQGHGWRYTLRPGLTWSDGRPVTAADVVYSLDHARDDHWPVVGATVNGLTARALDAHTVAITSSTTSLLPGLRLNVVPAHVYTKVPDVNRDRTALGVGDGAWHVVTTTRDSVTLGVLGRPGGPPLDQIVFRTFPNSNALIDALAGGTVDVISGVARSEIDRLRAVDGVTVNPVGDLVQAFRTGNVTGFLPEPTRPGPVVFGPSITPYFGIVAASKPPGEQLSNVTYAIAGVVLAALCVLGYWVASRVRKRLVTPITT
jgi:peptide/nickel transport system substrate-binding protein